MTVTLDTLAQSSRQEIFDHVAAHLLQQGIRAMRNGRCAYRGENGSKCAVGCLMTDDEYKPEMDMRGVSYGTAASALVNRGLIPDTQHNTLLAELQTMHDNDRHDDSFRHALITFAQLYDLNYSHIPGLEESPGLD